MKAMNKMITVVLMTTIVVLSIAVLGQGEHEINITKSYALSNPSQIISNYTNIRYNMYSALGLETYGESNMTINEWLDSKYNPTMSVFKQGGSVLIDTCRKYKVENDELYVMIIYECGYCKLTYEGEPVKISGTESFSTLSKKLSQDGTYNLEGLDHNIETKYAYYIDGYNY